MNIIFDIALHLALIGFGILVGVWACEYPRRRDCALPDRLSGAVSDLSHTIGIWKAALNDRDAVAVTVSVAVLEGQIRALERGRIDTADELRELTAVSGSQAVADALPPKL